MNRTIIIGIAGAVIVLIALLLNSFLNQTPDSDNASLVSPPAAGDAAAPDDSASDEQSDSQRSDSAENAQNRSETNGSSGAPALGDVANQVQGEETENRTQKPSFDVVRVSKSGDTVIAGRAPAGSTVTILDDGETIGSAVADARGEWVYLPDQPLKAGPHNLALQATTTDGQIFDSDNKVVLVVPETGRDIAGRPRTGPQQPLALLVPKKPGDLAVRVLQKPSVPGSVESETGELALDNVDYDEEGRISLGGRGLPAAEIRAYLNDQLIGLSTVPETGLWRIRPDETITPGSYRLRLDMVKPQDGDVIARIELPFSRAKPMQDFSGDSFVVVQPGNSLWRIARRTLDEGLNYTVIYEANKEQIRDPDLIYPGQIFEIPSE